MVDGFVFLIRLGGWSLRFLEGEDVSEKKQRRSWTPEKTEIVLAGLRGDCSVRDVCREHQIFEALYYQWRDRLLEAGWDAPDSRPTHRVVARIHPVEEPGGKPVSVRGAVGAIMHEGSLPQRRPPARLEQTSHHGQHPINVTARGPGRLISPRSCAPPRPGHCQHTNHDQQQRHHR